MSIDNLNGTLSSTGNLNGTFGTSGGGGTSNYNDLANKPQINGNTLEGNKTPAQLGINIPDMTNYYNKSETNTLLNGKANVSDLPDMNNYYDKSETDTLLDGKADTSDLPDMSNYYNKSETDTLLDSKVNNSSFNAVSLPIESGSATNTKDYIDSGLSGKADTGSLNDKQNKNVLNIIKTYNSGSSIDALQDIITTYGKVSMIFAFSVAGVGQYFGMLTFYNDNLGGGYFINQGGRFWAIVYSAGTFTLTEKT